jgi:ribosomal protein S18 acetylase RimI-like enzyme
LVEIRPPKQGDIDRQKEIWKLCFGDTDDYIDFYFAERYEADETLLLCWKGEVAAMLTMIPVTVVAPDGQGFAAAMQYAIATHPGYRGRGFATQLMDFSNRYLANNHAAMSLLVPAESRLFGFYRKRGYIESFYIAEAVLDVGTIQRYARQTVLGADGAVTTQADEIVNGQPDEAVTTQVDEILIEPVKLLSNNGNVIMVVTDDIVIEPAKPNDYNVIREKMLKGSVHVAYRDKETTYQKKLSRRTGADIYTINAGRMRGCAVAERINADRVLVKELLIPEHLIGSSIAGIAKLLPAKSYVVRLPAHQSRYLGGTVRPFGMAKLNGHYSFINAGHQTGYLGIAFD